MCSRFELDLEEEALLRLFNAVADDSPWNFEADLYPGRYAPVLLNEGTEKLVQRRMRWGLGPHWAKNEKIGRKTWNARSETLHQKPSFRDAFRDSRCLVPATAFYEPSTDEQGNKHLHRFSMEDGSPFAMAGLHSVWKAPDELFQKYLYTFTLITTEPNQVVSPFHPRMPVILGEAERVKWLEYSAEEELRAMLKPYEGQDLVTGT